ERGAFPARGRAEFFREPARLSRVRDRGRVVFRRVLVLQPRGQKTRRGNGDLSRRRARALFMDLRRVHIRRYLPRRHRGDRYFHSRVRIHQRAQMRAVQGGAVPPRGGGTRLFVGRRRRRRHGIFQLRGRLRLRRRGDFAHSHCVRDLKKRFRRLRRARSLHPPRHRDERAGGRARFIRLRRLYPLFRRGAVLSARGKTARRAGALSQRRVRALCAGFLVRGRGCVRVFRLLSDHAHFPRALFSLSAHPRICLRKGGKRIKTVFGTPTDKAEYQRQPLRDGRKTVRDRGRVQGDRKHVHQPGRIG
ncbi:hypothetical protein AV274_5497, partial [Blastocystis sp. ATCC 50177/Nand II]